MANSSHYFVNTPTMLYDQLQTNVGSGLNLALNGASVPATCMVQQAYSQEYTAAFTCSSFPCTIPSESFQLPESTPNTLLVLSEVC